MPEEWVNKRVKDLLSLNTEGIKPELHKHISFHHFSLPAYDAGATASLEFGSEIKSNKTLIRKPSVLLSKLNPHKPRIWNIKEVPSDSVCSTEFLNLEPKPTLHQDFGYHYLLSNLFTDEMLLRLTGSTNSHKRVRPNDVMNIPINLPPLPEQKKIASILTSVDEAIAKTKAIIDQTKKLKKGMMQELLTRGIGHTRFKQTEIGEIPESWDVVTLGELANVKGGKRVPKGESLLDEETPFPYIRIVDFKNGSISMENMKYLSENIHSKIKRYTISRTDLYISVAGALLGLVGEVPKELDGANLTENANKIMIKDISQTDIKFLKQLLWSDLCQNQISVHKGVGGGVPKLALFRIQALKLTFPPLEEQKKISIILENMDKQIYRLKDILLKHQKLKSGLMNELLNGKVRVKNV